MKGVSVFITAMLLLLAHWLALHLKHLGALPDKDRPQSGPAAASWAGVAARNGALNATFSL